MTGQVVDSKRLVRYVINGTWDNKIEHSRVLEPIPLEEYHDAVKAGKLSTTSQPVLGWQKNPLP